MKALLASLFLIAAALAGCESDVPPAPNSNGSTNPLERGISGQGTLTQPDKSDDPLIKGSSPSGN